QMVSLHFLWFWSGHRLILSCSALQSSLIHPRFRDNKILHLYFPPDRFADHIKPWVHPLWILYPLARLFLEYFSDRYSTYSEKPTSIVRYVPLSDYYNRSSTQNLSSGFP